VNLKEAYEAMGADCQPLAEALGGEEILAAIVKKIGEDENYGKLEAALAANDVEGAFKAAHAMKGMCLNLGIDMLGKPTAALTDALRERSRNLEAVPALWQEVQESYAKVTEVIKQLD